VGFNEGGSFLTSIRPGAARRLFIADCRGVGIDMNAIDFPLYLRNIFGKLFQPTSVAGITKTVHSFSIPYGNDLQILSVFGKWRLFQRGTSGA
jgi:hypothetical protein